MPFSGYTGFISEWLLDLELHLGSSSRTSLTVFFEHENWLNSGEHEPEGTLMHPERFSLGESILEAGAAEGRILAAIQRLNLEPVDPLRHFRRGDHGECSR
jgi:hypothetical protein